MTTLSARIGFETSWAGLAMLAAALMVPVVPRASQATVKEIEAKGTYHLGDNDTKLVGHRLALLEAKRNALEKAGTYVQSITEVKDYQLTKDEIRTYSAGILQVEETKEPEWVMEGKNLEVTVYVKATVDDADVSKKIGALRQDKDATRQLKESRAQVVENEKKITELNKQLKKSKKGSPAAEKAQAARSEAIEGVDKSTLQAQAAVAEKFGIQAYQATKAYMQRQMPAIKGCYHSAVSGEKASADRDRWLAVLAAPPVGLLVFRPRKTDVDSRRRDSE